MPVLFLMYRRGTSLASADNRRDVSHFRMVEAGTVPNSSLLSHNCAKWRTALFQPDCMR
jgi:hypothetical protein